MFSENDEYFENMYLGITNCVRSGESSHDPQRLSAAPMQRHRWRSTAKRSTKAKSNTCTCRSTTHSHISLRFSSLCWIKKTAHSPQTTSRSSKTPVRSVDVGHANHNDDGNHTTTKENQKYHDVVDDLPNITTNKSKNNIHEGRNKALPDMRVHNKSHTKQTCDVMPPSPSAAHAPGSPYAPCTSPCQKLTTTSQTIEPHSGLQHTRPKRTIKWDKIIIKINDRNKRRRK